MFKQADYPFLQFKVIRGTDGRIAEPDPEDGYVGSDYKVGDRLVFDLSMPKEVEGLVGEPFAFRSFGPKHHAVKDVSTDDERLQHRLVMPLEGQRFPFPRINLNHCHVLLCWPDGRIHVVVVGVISRSGDFFVVCHPAFVGSAYTDDEHRVLVPSPRFDVFRGPLYGIVTKRLHRVALPHIAKFAEEPTPAPPEADDEGLVLWWNPVAGYGAVSTRRGVARLHWLQLLTGRRLREATPGERVRFKTLDYPKVATRPTSFAYEMLEARIIGDNSEPAPVEIPGNGLPQSPDTNFVRVLDKYGALQTRLLAESKQRGTLIAIETSPASKITGRVVDYDHESVLLRVDGSDEEKLIQRRIIHIVTRKTLPNR